MQTASERDRDRLAELLDRDEITRVLYRICRGLDRADADLYASGYHPDATEVHADHSGSAADFRERALRRVPVRFEVMRHALDTITIEISGERAHVESYVTAECVLRERHDGRKVVTTLHGRYVDLFERRNGEWRIAHRVVVKDFRDVRPIDDPPEQYPLAQWGTGDPSYARGDALRELRPGEPTGTT